MYHVKKTDVVVPGGLDLNIADEDEFSPDKFRSTIERLYMTVVHSPLYPISDIVYWFGRICKTYC